MGLGIATRTIMRFAGLVAAATIVACGSKEAPPPPAASGVQTRDVTYKEGDTPLKGFVAWDAGRAERRPGILVVHEWWGLNDHARNQARRLAAAGYVGFALDMYGNGKNTTHPDSAQAFMAAVTGANVARW